MFGISVQELLVLLICCGGPVLAGITGLLVLLIVKKNKNGEHARNP